MNELWIQIKFWTKTTLISVLAIYIALFIYNNTGESRMVNFWWWFGQEPKASAFVLALLSFAAGSLVTLLVRTTFATMRQYKKAKAARLLKEREDQLLKASKLQTKSAPPVTIDPDAV